MIKHITVNKKILAYIFFTVLVSIMIIFLIAYDSFYENIKSNEILKLDTTLYFLIGFIAQIIDGTIGMGYGVISSTILLSNGMQPSISSASVHFTKIFTNGISGLSHLTFRNIDKNIFIKIVIPGIIGALTGSFILILIKPSIIRPFIFIYLILMAIRIIYISYRKTDKKNTFNKYKITGFIGGLADAIGGGGWGPIVTSTLIANNTNPHKTIGSVNASEFFIAFTTAFTLINSIKFIPTNIVIGLLLGGVLAAPISAYLCKKINSKFLMLIISIFIITTCTISLLNSI
ncbi:MAG: sulfite exporter TauE/SafE family protein [Bacteroidales bacterium]|nr:sulfite exporter TauE/SafE family protein [Bacteroidales bacterium]